MTEVKKKLVPKVKKEEVEEVDDDFGFDEEPSELPTDSDYSYVPSEEFSFLVKKLNEIDFKDTYELLVSKIKLGKRRLDPDVLSEAIDDAPEWAFKAAQLHIIAKERLAVFEDVTYRLAHAKLAQDANIALEKEKKLKKFTGQITKERVENWITMNHPGYQQLLKERRELKMAVEAFASLSAQFESKKSLLQTQGRLAEKKNQIVLGGK